MGKRTAYLHVGLPGPGDVLDAAVQQHRTRLAELGVTVPTKAREESYRAALELRRRHKTGGYRRKEVEGAWAGIARRALKGRTDVLVAQSALAGAGPDEIELACSQLPGLRLHVVVTASAPDAWSEPGDPERDLVAVLERWSAAVRSPDRVHVVVAPRPDRVGVEESRRLLWRHLGDVVGFGTRSLSVDDLAERPRVPEQPVDEAARDRLVVRADGWREALARGGYDVRGDLGDLDPAPAPASGSDPTDRLLRTTLALADAQVEIERLTRRTESLEARVDELEATPRRLRRVV